MVATVLGIRYGMTGPKRWDDAAKTTFREYENVYNVRTESDDDAAGSVLTAMASFGVFIGATWAGGSEIDSGARCIDIDPEEIGPLTWQVRCRWSTHSDRAPSEEETQEEEAEVHPTDRTPRYNWSSETIELLQTRDAITGEPLVNAVGEPFYAVRPYEIPVLTIRRYQASFDPDIFKVYVNHTNETDFWGADPGVALLAKVWDDPVEIDGESLREVSYVIKFNFSENDPLNPGPGWKHSFLNEGTVYKVYVSVPGSPVDHYETFQAQGQPITGRLTLDGEPLPEGDDPVYYDFNQFPQAELNDLDLGPTWS